MASQITCRHHGPLVVEGDFTLKDPEGKIFDLSGRTKISLCRCGYSENKPFCDGSHKRHAFESAIVARTLPPPAAPKD